MSGRNTVQLITYIDRLGGGTIPDLQQLLDSPLRDVFGGVHLLPFFYPIDGEDAGFDPIDHTQVDQRLGDWQDIGMLGERVSIMADMIVNHISAQSRQFKDVLKHGPQSTYWSLFLTKQKIFGDIDADQQDEAISQIYRPRPTPCFSDITLKNGQTIPFWTTFTANQIDIDVESSLGQTYLNNILTTFAKNNIDIIRLDAAGYAIKKAGSRCFMLEETFGFIEQLSDKARTLNMQCLVEIHSHYETQIDIARRCDLVYDFALPPLVLHGLFNQDATILARWLQISPRNCVTVLDTHDGIGIVDVGPAGDKPGLLDNNQIDQLVETIHQNSNGESKKATGAAASNVDLYQVNCTYYDALGQNDLAYLIARAIQFFSPGIPQVYYAGLFAVPNDMALLEKTNVGRDINRPYITTEGIQQALQKPVVNGLIKLIKLRNELTAFDGNFRVNADGPQLTMAWASENSEAQLEVDLSTQKGTIQWQQGGQTECIELATLLQ